MEEFVSRCGSVKKFEFFAPIQEVTEKTDN